MIRFVRSVAALAATLIALMPPAANSATVYYHFGNEDVGSSYAEGQAFGPWVDVFNGYGHQAIVVDSYGHRLLQQRPQASASSAETHASLTTTVSSFTPRKVVAEFITVSQLRTPNPNPWEVGWLLWNYGDTTHFYYVALKPNGWEVGKADPGYPGNQRFIASGSNFTFPVGHWQHIEVTQGDTNGYPTFTVQVNVNGSLQTLTTFTDWERPYASGRVGLYNEDALVHWGSVTIEYGSPRRRR